MKLNEIVDKLERPELEDGAVIAEEKCGCRLVLHKKHLNDWDNVRWFEVYHVACGRSKHVSFGNRVLRLKIEYVLTPKPVVKK